MFAVGVPVFPVAGVVEAVDPGYPACGLEHGRVFMVRVPRTLDDPLPTVAVRHRPFPYLDAVLGQPVFETDFANMARALASRFRARTRFGFSLRVGGQIVQQFERDGLE